MSSTVHKEYPNNQPSTMDLVEILQVGHQFLCPFYLPFFHNAGCRGEGGGEDGSHLDSQGALEAFPGRLYSFSFWPPHVQ